MTSEAEIAWAAGLFEGEGSAFVGSGQRQAVVTVQMTDEDVVRRFSQIMDCGHVRSYVKAGKRKDVWHWTAGKAEDVIAVLELLMPYLGERRRAKALIVIDAARAIVSRRDLCKRGHDLNDPTHCYTHAKTGKRHCRTCRIDAGRRRRCLVA